MKKNDAPSRRQFLQTAAVVAGGAALAVPAGKAAAPQPAVSKPAARGYRKTAHISRYYQLAREL